MSLSSVTPQTTQTYPIKLMGHITWTYPDRQPETFPVTRAIVHEKDHVTLDCDCGTAHAPYLYLIDTRSSVGNDFVGTFTGGRSPSERSSGQVSGRYEVEGHILRLRGLWIEQSAKSDWLAELHPVKTFPDEATNT